MTTQFWTISVGTGSNIINGLNEVILFADYDKALEYCKQFPNSKPYPAYINQD